MFIVFFSRQKKKKERLFYLSYPFHYKWVCFIDIFKEQAFGFVEHFYLFVSLKILKVDLYKSNVYLYKVIIAQVRKQNAASTQSCAVSLFPIILHPHTQR